MAFIGFVIILVLYAKQLFAWGPSTISYFAATQSAARSLGVLVLAPLLFRGRTVLPASLVISGSLLFQTAAFTVYGLAKSTRTMFIGTAFEGLSSVSIPTMRAVFSRANPPTEQGKVLSVISAIETVINIAVPIFIPYLFSLTNVDCPRCTLYVVIGCSAFAFFISLVFGVVAKRLPDERERGTEIEASLGAGEEKASLVAAPLAVGSVNGSGNGGCPYIEFHDESYSRDPLVRASRAPSFAGIAQVKQ